MGMFYTLKDPGKYTFSYEKFFWPSITTFLLIFMISASKLSLDFLRKVFELRCMSIIIKGQCKKLHVHQIK